jgi:hypothetical protein
MSFAMPSGHSLLPSYCHVKGQANPEHGTANAYLRGFFASITDINHCKEANKYSRKTASAFAENRSIRYYQLSGDFSREKNLGVRSNAV